MTKKLPLFYFPPKICWVDDNELFLEAANRLFNEDYTCLQFSNSEEALNFLTLYTPPSSSINFTREFTESDIFGTHNRLPIDINISEITTLATSSISIHDEIAILIIDNDMPHINGIEICHKLKDSPFKKILLTGQTSPTEVVDAFNYGIIDKFISKDQYVSDKLQRYILQLCRQYFYEQTNNLLSHIETSQLSPLSDPIFIDFFYQWCEANKYKEFYLINRHGSFLLKDNTGSLGYFIVLSESSKDDFLKSNDDAPENVKNLLLQISRGESIPFFGIGKESWEFVYDDWNNYLYPANVIQGREKYYWTTINKKENNNDL